jgi:hypothetical protein
MGAIGREIQVSSPAQGDAAFYDPTTTLFQNRLLDAERDPNPAFEDFFFFQGGIGSGTTIIDPGIPAGYVAVFRNTYPLFVNAGAVTSALEAFLRRGGVDYGLRGSFNVGATATFGQISCANFFLASGDLIRVDSTQPNINIRVRGHLVPIVAVARGSERRRIIPLTGLLAAGDNTLYTCPAGKKARCARGASAFNAEGALCVLTTVIPTTAKVRWVKTDLVSNDTRNLSGQIAASNIKGLALPFDALLSAGESVVVNVDQPCLYTTIIDEENV